MSVHFLPILWYRVVIHLMVFRKLACFNKKITPNFNELGVCLVAGKGFRKAGFVVVQAFSKSFYRHTNVCLSSLWTNFFVASNPCNHKKNTLKGVLNGCGGRIWTNDLQVMSLTSYRAALPRDNNMLGSIYALNFLLSRTFFNFLLKLLKTINLLLPQTLKPIW